MDNFTSSLDEQFARLHERSLALIEVVPADKLYWQPRQTSGAQPVYSCGELLVRSAGTVEQTFGGLTTNLWDDPFEWTLPESLDTTERVAEYLAEVEKTRCRGFELFPRDDVLMREIAMPSGEMRTIFALLMDTLARAYQFQGQAFATFRLFSDARLPRT